MNSICMENEFKILFFLGNIFIHRNPKLLQSPESGLESCEEEEEFEEAVIYKIGNCSLLVT